MAIRLFSSESVTEGHPDKLCDRISDSILDTILAQDPMARVACECAVSPDVLLIMGEITTDASYDAEAIARKAIRETGYTDTALGFDADTCRIITALNNQSPDIASGVGNALEAREGAEDERDSLGAGDQGMMFGYASDETPALMPMPIYLAHKLARKLAEARKTGALPYLRPDGKTQVTVIYDGDRPIGIDNIIISTQHSPDVDQKRLQADIEEYVVRGAIDDRLLGGAKLFINPSGRFVVGGPAGDTGLTGRKIIVDTYGGFARHGGGAFSGKDPTKVDRSAAYMARFAAKNIVAAGLAKRCELQIAYAIGKARPVSMFVETFGTAAVPESRILKYIEENFDFRPMAIIERLGLRRPIYKATSSYGHFGREDVSFPWEEII